MRRLFFISILCLVALSFAGCDKVYVNGVLDGQWKLLSVEKAGIVEQPAVMITYSFQRHTMLLALHHEEELPYRYIGEFDHSDGFLYTSGFVRFPGVSAECYPEELERYYIFSESEKFKVERLDEDILVMSTTDRIYRLRKW